MQQINQYDENGRQHGYWEDRWTNGEIATIGYFIHGKREGEWKSYFRNKKLANIGVYKDGCRIGKWTYYKRTGCLSAIVHWTMNEPDGLHVEYHPSGLEKETAFYAP